MFGKIRSLAYAIIIIIALSFVLTQSALASSVVVFNKDLRTGSENTDVKELQKFLNNNGFVLNKSGAGSVGKETNFFGSITRNALIKFQKANRIVPAIGYFGSITRSAVNKIVKSLTKSTTNSASSVSEVKNNLPVNQTAQTENQANQNTKSSYYTIGGSITGVASAVVLQNNGQDDLIIDINQNSNFTFQTALADGANYNVTVKPKDSDQTCYVINNTGLVSGADINNVKIACGVNLSYNPLTYIPSSGNDTPRINTYAVTFDANGSTGGTAPSNQTKTHDVVLALATNSGALVKTGYTFSGWNTSADGTGTNYAAGANYSANSDITLYAKWVAAPSALSYNSPNLFVVGTAISTFSPTVSGSVDSYSISPSLPAGLLLNTSNGQITGTPTASTTQSTYTVTATNAGGSTSFGIVIMVDGTVVGANGKVWLDRNVGAVQVATSSTDYLAYGDLFQWGRPADGHQLITWTSSTTSTSVNGNQSGQVANVAPTTTAFIIPSADWSSIDSDGATRLANWGVGGSSNPCPTGFRVPTEAEINTERLSWGSQNSVGAFNSPLKLPVAGYRNNENGVFTNTGLIGHYWANTVNGASSRSLTIAASDANMYMGNRAYGFSVRCTADSYAVAYDDNGSTGGTAPSNQTKTHNVTLTLSTNSGTLVKTGYTFSGWNTSADGTGTDYAEGANYTANTGATLYAKWVPILAVGVNYQGGKVAYIFQNGDTGYAVGETHGLIVSLSDLSTSIYWHATSNGTTGATGTAIGTGLSNTNAIVATYGVENNAARLAYDYTNTETGTGVYSDWYLPAKDELNKIYTNRVAIGGIGNNFYWSSSEANSTLAWHQWLFNGGSDTSDKNVLWYVRAIRSF